MRGLVVRASKHWRMTRLGELEMHNARMCLTFRTRPSSRAMQASHSHRRGFAHASSVAPKLMDTNFELRAHCCGAELVAAGANCSVGNNGHANDGVRHCIHPRD
jgi:hypothetical protein